MLNLKTRIVNHLPSADKIVSNINFGTATGLTKTAKEGQSASVGAIKGTFITRGTWFQANMRHGIKIKPATKTNLQAEVRTMADWLEPHETGTDKKARSGRVAVPTEDVRRNKRQIIPRNQRPAALRAKKTFIIQTSRGPVLYQRIARGSRKGLVALYGLEPKVKIAKRSTFYEPIKKVVDRRLTKNIKDGIDNALRTMR